jgi:hypothetical protein
MLRLRVVETLKCSESRSRCGRPRWDRGVGALSAFKMRAIRCCPTRDRGVHALVTSAQAARRESNHFPRKAGGQIDHGPIERPHPLAKRSARISLDSWCEQWRRREPSEVLGDGRERQRQSDQDYVQSYPLRPLAHPFQPFFVGLDPFSRALSPSAGRQASAGPTPRAGRVSEAVQLTASAIGQPADGPAHRAREGPDGSIRDALARLLLILRDGRRIS